MPDTLRHDDSTGTGKILDGLTDEQQLRLSELLDGYLAASEEQNAPSRTELIAANPDLAQALSLYLDKLDELQCLMTPSSADSGSLNGKVLGDYRLKEEIGRGGMGIVFSAEQQSLQREVAVKLLPMAVLLDPKYVERFKNEARAAAQLEHPNIVPVYAIGEDGGIHYFAMRLIHGQSLDAKISSHREHNTLPPTESALLKFAEVADALQCAHEFGIVHRDIKPSNLLLEREGRLWVADFGLARFQAGSAVTRTGEMLGTMRYMSPEQASGQASLVDQRTAFYSLGATLYELLTLRPAVPGEEGPGLLRTIETQSPIRLRKLRPECSRDLQTVLERAMARSRDDRYQSAAEFAEDLRRVANREPIRMRPLSPLILGLRWASRHSRVVALAAVGAVALAAWLVISNLMIRYEFNRAEQNLYLNHSTVDQFGTQLIDELALLPGAEQIRSNLVRKTLKYYTDFVQQSKDSPKLKSALAGAYSRMGALSEELGELEQAVDYYEKAEQIYANLQTTAPREDFRVQRNANSNQFALTLDRLGKPERGLQLLNRPVEDQRQRIESEPGNASRLWRLALTLNNRGLILNRVGRTDEAQESFAEAVELLETARSMEPNDQAIIRALGASQQNWAAIVASLQPDQAKQLLNAAIESQLWVADHAQNRLRASRDLVASYIALGNLQMKSDPQAAILEFERAELISGQLVAISPDFADYRNDLSVSQNDLGLALFQTKQFDRAKKYLVQASENYDRLVKQFPDRVDLQVRLASALNNQGIVEQQLNDFATAENCFQRAVEILEPNLGNASNLQIISILNQAYSNHVRLLKSLGRIREANQLEKQQMSLQPSMIEP